MRPGLEDNGDDRPEDHNVEAAAEGDKPKQTNDGSDDKQAVDDFEDESVISSANFIRGDIHEHESKDQSVACVSSAASATIAKSLSLADDPSTMTLSFGDEKQPQNVNPKKSSRQKMEEESASKTLEKIDSIGDIGIKSGSDDPLTSHRQERAVWDALDEEDMEDDTFKLLDSDEEEERTRPGAQAIVGPQHARVGGPGELTTPDRTVITDAGGATIRAVLVNDEDDAEAMLNRLRDQGRVVSAQRVVAINPNQDVDDIEDPNNAWKQEEREEALRKQQERRRLLVIVLIVFLLLAGGAIAAVMLTVVSLPNSPADATRVPSAPVPTTQAPSSAPTVTFAPSSPPTMVPFTGLSIQQLGPGIVGSNPGDGLGFDTAMSDDGNRVAVGMYTEDGSVKVLEYTNAGWVQLGDDITQANTNSFGKVVAMNDAGTRVAAGYYLKGGREASPGHVNIYEWDGEAWNQLGDTIDGEADGDGFGFAMYFDSAGDRIIISCIWNGGNGIESGHARVFDFDGSSWNQVGEDIDGRQAGDRFGFAVAMSSDGSRIGISAAAGNGTTIEKSGYVQLYDWTDGEWRLQTTLEGDETEGKFGQSLDFSSDGTWMAIGARRSSGGGEQKGQARVYKYEDDEWMQVGDDINGATSAAASGFALALSNNGETVVIGANGENEGVGSARVFGWNSEDEVWEQIGLTLTGVASGDSFGFSVNINGIGRRILVGAPDRDSAAGEGSGEVKVFQFQ